MKLLYTSDLHGSRAHYAKLQAMVEPIAPDVLVLGGDLFPDDSALHPDLLGLGQPEFIKTFFRKFVEQVRRQKRCKAILMIYGNHDWASCVPAVEDLSKAGLVQVLGHERELRVDGMGFVGYSCTPPTPWFVKDFERLDLPGDAPPLMGGARWDARFSRPVQHGAGRLFEGMRTIADDLGGMCASKAPWAFVAHAPPIETNLDRAYGQKAFGSKAVRDAIRKHQPLLSFHGHIHESPTVSGHWQDQLGKTLAINPGQSTKQLCYAVVDIDVAGSKIVKAELCRSFTEEL